MYAGMFGGRSDDREGGSNPIALLAMMIAGADCRDADPDAASRARASSPPTRAARAIAGTPYGLADALRKIDAAAKRVPLDANPATAHMFIIKPFLGGGLMSLFSTHPPTEARIQALLQHPLRRHPGSRRCPLPVLRDCRHAGSTAPALDLPLLAPHSPAR